MSAQPTCENCIVYLRAYHVGDPANLREGTCERLRATGACLVQKSPLILIVVAHRAGDVEALARGTQLSWRNLEAITETREVR